MEALSIVPIGRVESAERDIARQDWRSVRSTLRLRPELAPTLLGLGGYSHVLVIGWLDRIPEELRGRLRAYPSGDRSLPEQGALALRGGARPNPLSVTVCRLLAVEGDGVEASLVVEGLDLVDGTPVLDVKPYIAYYDAVPDATLPGWAGG